MAVENMETYDPEQVNLMNEMCIKVNDEDYIEGPVTKKFCHLMTNITAGLALHRAFSVFIFNSEGKLLLQQRAMAKITFPGYWTNTCCSHPLWVESEKEGVDGVKRAAIRKLYHELGIVDVHFEDVAFLTRILYQAPSDGLWGEHEIDYILFVQKDVKLDLNENEVMNHRFVDQGELKEMLEDKVNNDFYTTFIYWYASLLLTQVITKSSSRDTTTLLDHRRIAQKQGLFTFQESSPGMVYFLPHGQHIIQKIKSVIRSEYRLHGYEEVSTPMLYSTDLWKQSGHLDNYAQNMYMINVNTAEDGESHVGLKPMNCPAHCLLFGSQMRSYKELPIRIADFSALHRNELSGTLTGLTRLRHFHQDDAHVFCTRDQMETEISTFLSMVRRTLLEVFKFKSYSLGLSTRPAKSIGDEESWNQAESVLKSALEKHYKTHGCDSYEVHEGDGAFYGPKIDVHVKDMLGRDHQLSTLQLDFQLPERFNLKYVDADSTFVRPVVIHRAVLGSLERFFAVWSESIEGKWPFWCSPRQCMIIPVSEEQVTLAQTMKNFLEKKYCNDPFSPQYRICVDSSDETLSKRVRNAEILAYNYIIVLGKKEQESGACTVRMRDKKGIRVMLPEDLKNEFVLKDQKFE